VIVPARKPPEKVAVIVPAASVTEIDPTPGNPDNAGVSTGALFALLSVNIFSDFMRTGHLTGMLLLASESLVIVLTVFRRRAHITDRSMAAVTCA
jgi:hypothetical protein